MDEKIKQIYEILSTSSIEDHLQILFTAKKFTAERVTRLDEISNQAKKAYSEIFQNSSSLSPSTKVQEY